MTRARCFLIPVAGPAGGAFRRPKAPVQWGCPEPRSMPIDSLSPSHKYVSVGARLLCAGAIAISAMIVGCRPAAHPPDTTSGKAVAMMADSAKPERPPGIVSKQQTSQPPQPPLDVSELILTLQLVDSANNPADLLVTDPAGRRTGSDPLRNGGLAEIPSAWYDSSPPLTQEEQDPAPAALARTFTLVTPPPGRYVVEVLGRRRGPYALEVTIVTPAGQRRRHVTLGAITRAGEIQRFEIVYAPVDSGVPVMNRTQ
jgi:hypothetical protein